MRILDIKKEKPVGSIICIKRKSMISKETFRQIALSFPETKEEPHFEKPAFKVAEKIFATLNLVENRATIKLTPTEQYLFSL